MPHNNSPSAYGLWFLVFISSALFIMFAFSFAKPQSKRDWRPLGAFSAFILALFTEMYGFPLTIYLLTPWLQTKFPGMDLLSHDMGHLWFSVLGFKGDPHFNPMHIASQVFIIAGFWTVASAWNVLYRAQKAGRIATDGRPLQLSPPPSTAKNVPGFHLSRTSHRAHRHVSQAFAANQLLSWVRVSRPW